VEQIMRLLFNIVGFFALIGAVVGAITYSYVALIFGFGYFGYWTLDVRICVMIFVVICAIWLVERAWREIIGASDK
jgi:hypothetical protein